jgi:hypothetical protein
MFVSFAARVGEHRFNLMKVGRSLVRDSPHRVEKLLRCANDDDKF